MLNQLQSQKMDQVVAENAGQKVQLLSANNDNYGGVTVEINEHMDSNVFLTMLRASMSHWKQQGKKDVWMKLSIGLANLVEPAVKEGFWYHHAESDYLMLVNWIPRIYSTIPINATHRVDVRAFVLNDKRENHFASDAEGNYERLTEAIIQNEAAMKQNIDYKKVNDEHVIEMPKGPDHSHRKEQANVLFRLCEVGLANTVSLMGSNPPPWATTPTSPGLLGFSGVANVVGYVGTTAALTLRYTKPGVARIFAKVGPMSCAWGVIMGFTSYLPGEFQWLGYVAALFCTLAVLLGNY
ncbi:hypothetical protein LguiA_029591 [Lonicera macranthoides]